MSNELTILLAMYEQQCNQARHYETQRATISGFVITISAALVALMTYDDEVTRVDLPAAMFLVALGFFGLLSSLTHYARSGRHGRCAGLIREKIDADFGTTVTKLRQRAKLEMEEKLVGGRARRSLRLRHIWYGVHVVVVVLGVMLMLMAVRA